MFDPADGIRPHIRTLKAYEPIQPFEVVSERLGRAPEAILKLDGNENPYGPLPEVREALANIRFPHIYPDPQSSLLRAALAEYTGVPAENLLAGAGADELIDLLMRLLLEPGDRILICPPTFGMYAFDAAVNSAEVIAVDRAPDFKLDLPAVLEAVRQYQPKMIFLASPNNPDGSLLPAEKLQALLELPCLIVMDEAYVEFAPAGSSCIQQVPDRANLAVLRTFSKWAGLAGLRVGYGAFPTGLMEGLWKIKQPYNVSVAADIAARVSLEHVEDLHSTVLKLVEERERLQTALRGIRFLQPYPSQSNFILCRVLDRQASELKDALAERGCLVRHFDSPPIQDLLRFTVGRPEDTKALLVALSELE
jgi:histidinol-phosphate aminotransferase